MQDLLSYIQSGADITDSVSLYTDRTLLKEYLQLENKINSEKDSLKVSELESEKSALREKIQESAVVIDMKLPPSDTRFKQRDDLLEKWGEGVEDTEEFQNELMNIWVGSAITKISSPVEVREGPLSRDEMATLRESLSSVPKNWLTVLNAFNQMVYEELMADMEFSSPDF